MRIPKGLGWLINFSAWIESRIEHSLQVCADQKENLLVPFLRKFWPKFISPNDLTLARLILSLLVIYWLIITKGQNWEGNNYLAITIIIACLTDFVDGPVARAINRESKFGSVMDKVVDKFLILPLGAVEFWSIDKYLVVFSSIGALIVIVAAIYKYFQLEEDIPENIFGKTGMICYSLGIILVIWPSWQLFALKIAWVGFGLGLASIIVNFRRHFGFSLQ